MCHFIPRFRNLNFVLPRVQEPCQRGGRDQKYRLSFDSWLLEEQVPSVEEGFDVGKDLIKTTRVLDIDYNLVKRSGVLGVQLFQSLREVRQILVRSRDYLTVRLSSEMF